MSEMRIASANTYNRERFVKVQSLGKGVSLLACHPNDFTALRSLIAEGPLSFEVDNENHHIILKLAPSTDLDDTKKALAETQSHVVQLQNQIGSVRNYTQRNADNTTNLATELHSTANKYDAGLKAMLNYVKETMQDHEVKVMSCIDDHVSGIEEWAGKGFDRVHQKINTLPKPKDHTKHIYGIYGVLALLIVIEVIRSLLHG